MKTGRAVLGLGAMLIFSHGVFAQDAVERAIEACQSELTNYCSTVTTGEGRLWLLMCLSADQDKVSVACAVAVYDAAIVINGLGDAIVVIAETCEQEIVDFCGSKVNDTEVRVEAGEGQVIECLLDHEAELGDNCRDVVRELLAD